MHHEVREFVARIKQLFPRHFCEAAVLEVGSLNLNGTVRDFFDRCSYVGLDLGEGPGVDRVCHVAEFRPRKAVYRTVICCEALEHDTRWNKSLRAMWQLLSPGGLLVLTCAGPERLPHGCHGHNEWCSPHTLDYYANLGPQAIAEALPVDWYWACSPLDTRGYAVRPVCPQAPGGEL